MVLVNDLEIGRTTTISNSSEPLWATEFHLPDELLLRTETPKTGDVGGGVNGWSDEIPSRPPSREGSISLGVVALEVWNSVPEGDPVLLGAVDIPSDLLQDIVSSSCHGGPAANNNSVVRRTGHEVGKDQVGGGKTNEISSDALGLHLLNLSLGTHPKKIEPQQQQLAFVGRGDNRTAVVEPVKVTSGEELRDDVGFISLSLKRVVAEVQEHGNEEQRDAKVMPEDNRHLSPVAKEAENVAKLGTESGDTEVKTNISACFPILLGFRVFPRAAQVLP